MELQPKVTWHGVFTADLATDLFDAFWVAIDQLAADRGEDPPRDYAIIVRRQAYGRPMALWRHMGEVLEANGYRRPA